jgi:hypothetical protein
MRDAFGPAFTVWVDRIKEGRFADTNQMFVPPRRYDERVMTEGAADYWADRILQKLHRIADERADSGNGCATTAGPAEV